MLLLQPALKDYLWGGQTLKNEYGKRAEMDTVAESWELSTHPDGLTRVASGAYAGRTLFEYLADHPEHACAGAGTDGALPVLVKLIDADKPLSIQVHPDDAYAQRTAGSPGKTELWYVLAAKPGAFIYLGVNRAVSRGELAARIRDNTVEDVLRRVPARPGEAYFIPAGTLHAVGAGVVLFEVQQSSNLTYRVYDFGRVDASGNPRPLHIAQALDVARLTPTGHLPPEGGRVHSADGAVLTGIVDCPYFAVSRTDLDGAYMFQTLHHTFMHILCIAGEATLRANGERIPLQKGGSVFLPAGEQATAEGCASLLLSGRQSA